MRIALLGLGLIGGSVARALRTADPEGGQWRLTAWTPSGEGPRLAIAEGVVHEAPGRLEDAIRGANLVILAAPPVACVDLIERLGDQVDRLAPGATITDTASTKALLTAAARDAGIPYVGGHPMAGRETSGFGAADADLFRGRPWVITEPVAGGDPEAVRTIALAAGADPIYLDAARHDRLVAAISHAPLLASVALAEAVTGLADEPDPWWPAAAALAATGWRDMTRLARGDTTMGAEIAASNAEAIAGVLRAVRDRLDDWIVALEDPGGPDAELLRRRLQAARERLEA
jgi:prephenate dehydrogenase